MKSFFSLSLTAVLFLCTVSPAQAQKNALKNLAKQVRPQVAAQVSARAEAAVKKIKKTVYPPWTPRTIRRSVFLIRRSPQLPFKGSGFVVQDPVTGQLWGVTARHIITYSSKEMLITFVDGHNKEHTFKAFAAARGNLRGADIMLLRLPPEAARVARPLNLAEKTVLPKEETFSFGYGEGVFQKIDRRQVYTVSPAYITTAFRLPYLLRDGYCGSPLLNMRGEVVGVHCGSIVHHRYQSAWQEELTALNAPEADFKEFSLAVPAFWIEQLFEQARTGKTLGTTLKINGITIAQLQPEEAVSGLVVIRNDREVQYLTFNPFFDYEHLEHFLQLQPGDKVHIKITRGDREDSFLRHFRYVFDTADGSVSKENIR